MAQHWDSFLSYCIWIDQEDYIWNALKYLNLLNANDTRTPLPEGVHLVAATTPTPPEKVTLYQQLIGTLLYTSTSTCPDIAFAVTRLLRYNLNPTDEHHRYAIYIIRYLKGMIKTQLHYDGSSHARLIGCIQIQIGVRTKTIVTLLLVKYLLSPMAQYAGDPDDKKLLHYQ